MEVKLSMEYKSTIKSRPFLYKETKKAAILIKQGVNLDEIKNKNSGIIIMWFCTRNIFL